MAIITIDIILSTETVIVEVEAANDTLSIEISPANVSITVDIGDPNNAVPLLLATLQARGSNFQNDACTAIILTDLQNIT